MTLEYEHSLRRASANALMPTRSRFDVDTRPSEHGSARLHRFGFEDEARNHCKHVDTWTTGIQARLVATVYIGAAWTAPTFSR